MKLYGHKSSKRSSMWSNSKSVAKFKTGKLKRNKMAPSNLVKRYKNRDGKARFAGNSKALKASAILGCIFFWKKAIKHVTYIYMYIYIFIYKDKYIIYIYIFVSWALAKILKWIVLRTTNHSTIKEISSWIRIAISPAFPRAPKGQSRKTPNFQGGVFACWL